MSMSVLVYVIITKIITTVECAPRFGHILIDPLNLEATELDSYTKIIKKASSAGIVQEQVTNKEIQTETMQPTTETFKNQSKEQIINSSTLNKDNKPNLAIEVTESNNEVAKNITNKENMSTLPQVVSVSDTSTSSEWLDPELDSDSRGSSSEWLSLENNSTEIDINKQISTQKPKIGLESSVDLHIHPLSARSNLDSTKDSQSESEIEATKTRYPKREIITPQKILMKILRSAAEAQEDPVNSEKPCAGYDYDVTICRYFGDRYLCGYNKNIGDLKDTEEIEDLGNGCRLRGDRKECGYNTSAVEVESMTRKEEVGTGNESDKSPKPNLKKERLSATKKKTAQPTTEAIKTSNSAQSTHTGNISNITTQSTRTRTSIMPKQACVEKDGRLVCYDVPE